MMNFIITNDGSSNPMRDALFTSANKDVYTKFSGSVATRDGCTMATGAPSGTPTACDTVLIVSVAQSYTNAAGVAACQPTINYGGGICDPDTWAKSVFEEMNTMRVEGLTVYKPVLDAMALGCSSMTCTYDWNGNGSTSAQTILNEAAGITAAGAAMVNNLPQYTWVPGMFMAAKDQSTYLATASNVSSTHGTSTLGSRAATYGTAGNTLVEGIYKGDNTARNTVARLLIDDNDATNLTFRNAAVASANAQAGVACGVHTDNQKVCTVVIGEGYVTSSEYSGCTTPVAAAVAPAVSGAAALMAGVSAAAVAYLF